jgi:23S rRNA (cytidine1920-2'-O)/16S rRNA (cytidine1409-2'-O)-methyltransferase
MSTSLNQSGDDYVSRAGYKLASVAIDLDLDFRDKVVLDVGSSTGGFSDYALKHGASKIIAVDKGTNQMDRFLRMSPLIELHEKTDIRDFRTSELIDLVLVDVSFTSLKNVLPAIKSIVSERAIIVAMAKPQFETANNQFKNRGVIKNEKYRRIILADVETWLKLGFFIEAKADSKVVGLKGNRERFYKLQKPAT